MNCKHELFYRIGSETDEHERRTYYTAICLECGHTEERRDRDFDEIIIPKNSKKDIKVTYDEVKKSYNLLKRQE